MEIEINDQSVYNPRKILKKIIPIILPFLIINGIWLIYFIVNDKFYLFSEKSDVGIPRWIMTIVMLFGSMVAGGTSEGGASIAFPVMTLAFNIVPTIARDFSFMIQSIGMSAASFTILYMNLKIDKNSILYSSIGGLIGIIIGLELIVKNLPPTFSKIYFVTIWASFAFQLYLLNREENRITFDKIMDYENIYNWKTPVLFIGGIVGGILSSISGSGIDIFIFSLLTLLFRLSEKVATPTSVILMAINTIIGFIYRGLIQGEISDESWKYFGVCIPVVVIGAPLGAFICSLLNRKHIAYCIYFTDLFQIITAFIIIRPWEENIYLTIVSPIIFILFCLYFYLLIYLGQKIMEER